MSDTEGGFGTAQLRDGETPDEHSHAQRNALMKAELRNEHSADAIRGVADDLRTGGINPDQIDKLATDVVDPATDVLHDVAIKLRQDTTPEDCAALMDIVADALESGADAPEGIRECIVCADAGGAI